MILVYCIMVTGPAYGNQRASSALQFSWELLNANHKISAIFFYQDGVYNANRFNAPASDEIDLVRSWHNLSQKHRVKLHVCSASSLRRGVINDLQSKALSLNGENLQPGFEFSGLASLAREALTCDRFIQF